MTYKLSRFCQRYKEKVGVLDLSHQSLKIECFKKWKKCINFNNTVLLFINFLNILDVHTFDDDMDLGCNVETHDLEHGIFNSFIAMPEMTKTYKTQ